MDLEELGALVAVVDHGSLLRASLATGLARTSLRRRVEALEARVGVPLLHRHDDGVSPTRAGGLLVKQGRRLLADAGALLTSIRELDQEPNGVLRIAMPLGVHPELQAVGYRLLRELMPGLRYSILTTDHLDSVSVDQIDLAFYLGYRHPEGPWTSVVARRVQVRALASRSYLQQHGTPRDLAELLRRDLFVWGRTSDPCAIPLRDGSVAPVEARMQLADTHALHHIGRASMGVVVTPDGELPFVDGEPLVPVLPEVVGGELPMWFCFPEALADLPKVRLTVERLRAYAAAWGVEPG